jgi:hypothetical protein
MKKSVQKTQTPIYFRYEFSDESGCPEGGDIFQFSSLKELQKMLGEVIGVAQEDGVTVSLTVGQDDLFFKFLKNTGLSQKEVEKEMVDSSISPFVAEKKAPKPKRTKKKAKK